MRTRALRRLAVFGALGMVVMVAPLPEVAFIETAVAATVALPAAEPVDAAELAEVQAAADEPLDADRVRATDGDVEEFSLMAVVFDEVPTDPVMVRVQGPTGDWERWQELHVAPDEGPDDPTNFGTEPFWVGSGQGYEVDLGSADAATAEVVLVRTELRRTVVVAEPVAGAAQAPPFGIKSRATWGARAVGPMSYGNAVRKAVVHHTVSGNSYSPSQVPGILKGIQAYHIDGRGWSDIGYNFLVDKYGGLWEGRAGGIDRPVIGAHASGFNTDSVGISVLGDYTSVSVSSAAVEAVSRAAGWKLHLGNVDPLASDPFTSAGGPRYAAGTVVRIPNVVGHGDVGSTGCPGRVRLALPAIRSRAHDWAVWSRATTSSPVGSFDALRLEGNAVTLWGWAVDRDASGQIPVQVWMDRKWRLDATIGRRRGDVAAFLGLSRDDIGYAATVAGIPKGGHTLCVVARNVGPGSDSVLGCRDVVVK